MLIPFAQENAPAFTSGQLAAFLGIAFFILGLIVLARKVFGHEPALHKEYAAKTEHEKLEHKVEINEAKNTSARKGIYGTLDEHAAEIARLKEAAERTKHLEAKIDANTALTAETRGEVKQINQNVERIQNSITSFLTRANK